MSKRPKLLIIGIDCADHAFLSRWMAEGHMPSLARLAERGNLLRCGSTLPAATAPAWTTAITGCDPGQHGIFDFLDLARPRERMFWAMPHGGVTLFKRLSDAGLTAGALNVPLTYPAEPIDGVIVSGLGAPDLNADAFYPRALRDELLSAVPDYALQPPLEPGLPPSEDALIRCVEARSRAAAYLLDAHPVDVFMVVFGALDWAVHGYAGKRDQWGTVRRVAQAIDRQVGALADQVGWPETPVLVVSDHGMRRVTRQVNLHKLFVELGLLCIEDDGGRRGSRFSVTRAAIAAWNLAKRLLPARVIEWVRRVGHGQRTALLESEPPVTLDWTRTIAAPVGYFGAVRLNVEGRDAGGIVPPGDYVTVRRDVARRLVSARDPVTGGSLFAEVYERDELYDGPLTEAGPDIVLTPATDDLAFGGASLGRELVAFMRQPGLVQKLVPPAGLHSMDGVFMLSGNAARARHLRGGCVLEDVTPTVLHLLGLPIPSYMEGRALTQCLSGAPAERPPVLVDEPLPICDAPELSATAEDEGEVVRRLRALGYV